MRINIDILKRALFLYGGKYLDLDTGETCDKSCIDRGWMTMPKHARLLPFYSSGHIYQKYLREMLPKTGIEDTISLAEFPDFVLCPKTFTKQERHFIGLAYHFVTGPEWVRYEWKHQENKESGSAEYDPTFKTYYEYSEAFQRKIAIEWCEKQGYEWYEE